MAGVVGPLSGGSADSVGDKATFGVVTVSDRASTGVYEDASGPAILRFFAEAVHSECAAHLCALRAARLPEKSRRAA